jgi:hypothetical protein
VCCPDCNLKMQQRRVRENRERIDRERYEFVAMYGKTKITGDTFSEVGDQLAALGYMMATVTKIAENTIQVEHPTRKPAAIQRVERQRNGG